ncbi:hypothetical protein BGX38DRAFT_1192514 [Terfezia claveryi]|nr:hypothetical protein BGX38DRAFT_1192514 [Terfezia claveryi]
MKSTRHGSTDKHQPTITGIFMAHSDNSSFFLLYILNILYNTLPSDNQTLSLFSTWLSTIIFLTPDICLCTCTCVCVCVRNFLMAWVLS